MDLELNDQQLYFGNSHESDFLSSEYSVPVSIEPNHELEIQEIKYDGEEIYKEPLTQSEHLASLISKIDFNEELNIAYTDDNVSKSNESSRTSNKLAQKLHRSLYDKIKQSYDEICVLLDCLSIANFESNLISLESGQRDEEYRLAQDERNSKALSIILKKKNLDAAKSLLRKCLDKIRSDSEYDVPSANKFHYELYRIRQFWRIKKVANKFIGDFSYRTIGCLNALRGNFEVLKVDFNREKQIDVIVPEEFEEKAFIRVQIVSNKFHQSDDSIECSLFHTSKHTNTDTHWQNTLEFAQNSLYAKELFNQILREAYDLQLSIKPLVIGNSIRLTINHNFDLIISLVHSNGDLSNAKKFDYDCCFLEYCLNQLLRKSFTQNFTHVELRPVTSMVAYNSRIKLAGITHSKEFGVRKLSIIQNVKDIAEHLLLKKKIYTYLSEISQEVSEPAFWVEPLLVNSTTSTDFRIKITSSAYEYASISSYLVKIRNNKVSVISQFGSIQFTDNVDNLKAYFIDQCCLNQVNTIQHLCRVFDWQLVSNGTQELQNHRCSILLLWHNLYFKKIALKLGPFNHIEVFLNKMQPNDPDSTNAFEWIEVENNFEKIDLNSSYPAGSIINKFEYFLAQIAC